jgi:hypothetical protein
MLRILALSTLLALAGGAQAEDGANVSITIDNVEILSGCDLEATSVVAFSLSDPTDSGDGRLLIFQCTLDEKNEVYVNFLFLPTGEIKVGITPFHDQAWQQ